MLIEQNIFRTNQWLTLIPKMLFSKNTKMRSKDLKISLSKWQKVIKWFNQLNSALLWNDVNHQEELVKMNSNFQILSFCQSIKIKKSFKSWWKKKTKFFKKETTKNCKENSFKRWFQIFKIRWSNLTMF